MADPKPVLPAEPPVQGEFYQPLSLLALASLVLAAGYALVLSGLGVVALVSGTTLFMGLWSLVFPVLAALLASAARLQIRRSEGILSGQVLTTWAWWLSVLFGLGYTAYYFGTFFAVSWQAERFTQKWFAKLREGKVAEAFLETQEPAHRKYVNPSDAEFMYNKYGPGAAAGPRKGPYSVYQDREYVWLVESGRPDEVHVDLRGVKSWDYEKGGFQVHQTYRITRPEGQYDLVVPVRSSEGKEIEGRQWQVVGERVGIVDRRLNPLGEALERWRQSARQFASDWVGKYHQGRWDRVYLDTLPAADREARGRAFFNGVRAAQAHQVVTRVLTGLIGGPIPPLLQEHPAVRCALDLPAFGAFAAGSLVDSRQFDSPRKVREDVVKAVKRHFLQPPVVVLRMPEGRAPFEMTQPEGAAGPVVQFLNPVDVWVYLPGADAAKGPTYRCDGALVVESDPGPITTERQPRWRVAALKLVRGGIPPASGPPQPGRGGATPPPAQ
jgi:hypothetical protein